MPRPLPPVEHRFKPGQSGNPAGQQKHNPEIKALRRMTHAEIAEVGSLIVAGDVPTLKHIVKSSIGKDSESKEHSVLKVWFASCALKAISKGDSNSLNVLLDRIVGKVKTEIEMTGAGGGPMLMAHMTLEDVRKEYDRLIQEEIESRGKPK